MTAPRVVEADDPFADLIPESRRRKLARAVDSDPFDDLVPKHNDPTLLDHTKEFVTDVAKGIGHFATHPWELVTAPAHEAVDALFTPVEGSESSGMGGRGGPARLPQGTKVTRENTPGAITPEQQRRAAIQATIDIPLLATGGSKALYPMIAASGAAHNPEHPIKGAAEAVAGVGVIHGATKLPGVADVSDGMVEAGTKDFARDVASEQSHGKTGMSPTRRPGPPPPVEPPSDAATVSTGETPLREIGPAGRSAATWLDVPKEAIGEIRRRPAPLAVPQLTPEQVAANLHPDTPWEVAVTIAESANRNHEARALETAHYPAEGALEPVASANGEFLRRPGVMRKVNAGQPALPSPMRLPPEPTPSDLAAAQPEGVKRISPEEVAARATEQNPVGIPEAVGNSEAKSVARARKAPDMFDKARTETGDLRPFHRVSDDGLLRELNEYQTKIVDAQQRAQYNYTPDENFHSTEDGRVVVSATRKNGRVSEQAKALQNLKDYDRIMTEIETELKKRGHTPDTIYERQQHLSDLDAAMERDAIEHADNEYDADTAFDFGDEPSVGASGDLKADKPPSEHVTGTAIRLPDGRVLGGMSHAEIIDSHNIAPDQLASAQDGFVTSRGRFVSREEASDLGGASESGDLRRTYRGLWGYADDAATGEAKPPISDILNVAKLDLGDKTAEQRVARQLEQHRTLRESNKQTFAEADVNRAEIVKELVSGDGKALNAGAAKRLSGEELLARRDVVRQNDKLIADLSKAIESRSLPVAEHEQAVAMVQKAVEHNDALLSDLVTGSSQKGRDLNLLRRIANRSLDPDVWQLQAKRLLGDRPITDEISTTIRRLSREAIEACGGAV